MRNIVQWMASRLSNCHGTDDINIYLQISCKEENLGTPTLLFPTFIKICDGRIQDLVYD